MGLITALIHLNSADNSFTVVRATESSPLNGLPVPILVLLAIGCLALAACVAGLTLGLMSLDSTALNILAQSTDPVQAAYARAIQPVREQGNLLLVTLLLSNSLATELLPLVLDALVPGGVFSLIVSVASVMFIGEIIPQAVCSRHPLYFGAQLIGFVKVLRTIVYPFAAPIAYGLDVMLGDELATVYNREELKGLIDFHATEKVLTQDETTILKGTLEFSRKVVADILTPAKNVFRLDIDSKLDRNTLLQVLQSGHSRIPLYDNNPNNIVCLLLVKQLILVHPDDELPIRALLSNKKRNHKMRVAPALECCSSLLISDLLNEFQKGRSHMAIVYDDHRKHPDERIFQGIVSLEDIIEEILQEEIIDETDKFLDNTNQATVLVRNAEGHLVRRTAQAMAAVTAVHLKEIDVSALRMPLNEALAGEAALVESRKMAHARRVGADGRHQSASMSAPLVRYSSSEDLEMGREPATVGESEDKQERASVSDGGSFYKRAEAVLTEDGSVLQPLLSLSKQPSNPGIQYAAIPGQSAMSLFGEDDDQIPEDVAVARSSSGTSGLNPSGKSECDLVQADRPTRKKLTVRPLPEHATDARHSEIPERKMSLSLNRGERARERARERASRRSSQSSVSEGEGEGEERS